MCMCMHKCRCNLVRFKAGTERGGKRSDERGGCLCVSVCLPGLLPRILMSLSKMEGGIFLGRGLCVCVCMEVGLVGFTSESREVCVTVAEHPRHVHFSSI